MIFLCMCFRCLPNGLVVKLHKSKQFRGGLAARCLHAGGRFGCVRGTMSAFRLLGLGT